MSCCSGPVPGFSGETLLVAGGGAGELTFMAVVVGGAVGGAGGAGEVILMSVAAGGAVGGATMTSISNNSESAGVLGHRSVFSSAQRCKRDNNAAQRQSEVIKEPD